MSSDPVLFWRVFFYGVGAGFLTALLLSALLTIIFLIAIVDRHMDEEESKQ